MKHMDTTNNQLALSKCSTHELNSKIAVDVARIIEAVVVEGVVVVVVVVVLCNLYIRLLATTMDGVFSMFFPLFLLRLVKVMRNNNITKFLTDEKFYLTKSFNRRF